MINSTFYIKMVEIQPFPSLFMKNLLPFKKTVQYAKSRNAGKAYITELTHNSYIPKRISDIRLICRFLDVSIIP